MILPPTKKNKAWIKSLNEEGRVKRVDMSRFISNDPADDDYVDSILGGNTKRIEGELERLVEHVKKFGTYDEAHTDEQKEAWAAFRKANAPKKRRRTKRRSTRSNIGDTL